MEDVTYQKYQDAVVQLCELAQHDTSGSRAAAQVLLSAYNGDRWQLDITDLCLLDYKYYEYAITVIRGRKELRVEPHVTINNGDDVFKRLCLQWIRYIDYNRWKYVCPDCNGRGETYVDNDFVEESSEELEQCYRCGGAGLLIPNIPNN